MQKSSTLFLRIPYDAGPTLAKSTLPLQKAIIDDILSLDPIPQNSSQMIITQPTILYPAKITNHPLNSFTQESLHINKKLTYNINYPSYRTSFPITHPFLMSDQVSTLEEKVLKPFWTNSSLDISRKLWLPVKTDSLALDSNSSKIFSIGLMPGLSSSILPKEQISKKNYQKTSSVLSHISQQNTQDIANTTKYKKNQNLLPAKVNQANLVKIEKQPIKQSLLAIPNQEKQVQSQNQVQIMTNKQKKHFPNYQTPHRIPLKNNLVTNDKRTKIRIIKDKNYEHKKQTGTRSKVIKIVNYNYKNSDKDSSEVSHDSNDSDDEYEYEYDDEDEINYDNANDKFNTKVTNKINTKINIKVINKINTKVINKINTNKINTNKKTKKVIEDGSYNIDDYMNNDDICDIDIDSSPDDLTDHIAQKIMNEGINFPLYERFDKSFVCRKIRFYPTKKQIEFFSKCFSTSRYIYNKGVEFINNGVNANKLKINNNATLGCIYLNNNKQCCENIDETNKHFCTKHKKTQGRWKGYTIDATLPTIRKNVLINDKDLTKHNNWQKDVPYDTRQLILTDLIAGYKSATTNQIRGNIKEFKLGYKSRKSVTQIFHINKNAITPELDIFKRKKLGKLRVRSKMRNWLNKNIKTIESNCKIIKYKGGQYYLLLSMKKETKMTKIPFDAVALDPGVRTFQTMYSPNGIVGEIGKGFASDELMKIAKKIDKLDACAENPDGWRIFTKRTARYRRNIRKRQALLRTKIKNKVSDLHGKTVNFLCENFKTIITTHFEIKEMTGKAERNINNKAVRMMLGLSHYAFKQRLLDRARRRGNHVYIVDESYTSKTCGRCGEIKRELGGSKIYDCKRCGMNIDRDINGARNIMIRLLTKEGSSNKSSNKSEDIIKI